MKKCSGLRLERALTWPNESRMPSLARMRLAVTRSSMRGRSGSDGRGWARVGEARVANNMAESRNVYRMMETPEAGGGSRRRKLV